jgi:ABC-type multidrug transport system ATPase subunit
MPLPPRKQQLREDNVIDDRDAVSLELGALTKRFGDITAVDNLSFRVKYGEIFSLLGPNGSGKTTAINMISGRSKPLGRSQSTRIQHGRQYPSIQLKRVGLPSTVRTNNS